MNEYAIIIISQEEFGISLDRVIEVLKAQKITPLPEVSGLISGVINLRGIVIPIMDLRKRLNVKSAHGRERIIIVKIHGEKIGLLVDAVKEVLTIEKEQIAVPLSAFKGLNPEYLNGIGKIGDRLIILLNLETLLTSEEIIEFKKISSSPPKP